MDHNLYPLGRVTVAFANSQKRLILQFLLSGGDFSRTSYSPRPRRSAVPSSSVPDDLLFGVFLETLSALAYKEIKKNGEFVMPGFGKLVKQKRKARIGFNPKTQQKIKIPAKTVVKFRVAKAAKDAVLAIKK
jgi:DNA-binding protein HU-beta